MTASVIYMLHGRVSKHVSNGTVNSNVCTSVAAAKYPTNQRYIHNPSAPTAPPVWSGGRVPLSVAPPAHQLPHAARPFAAGTNVAAHQPPPVGPPRARPSQPASLPACLIAWIARPVVPRPPTPRRDVSLRMSLTTTMRASWPWPPRLRPIRWRR